MKIQDVAVGRRVLFPSGKAHDVLHQGTSGTLVRPARRIPKAFTDGRTGEARRFTSAAKPFVVSGTTEVTLIESENPQNVQTL